MSNRRSNGGKFFFRSIALAAVLGLWLGLLATRAAEPDSASSNSRLASGDLVRFRNGDLLYGALRALNVTEGLQWRHPDVAQPIAFKLDNVDEISLANLPDTNVPPANPCLVRLTNQDEFAGGLVSANPESFVIDTWFAGPLTVPRKLVHFLQPKPPPAPPIFSGPEGVEGWTLGKVSSAVAEAGEWRYRNGAFYATRAASIARDMKLPDVASLEFDLAWRGSFHLALALYTDFLEPINLGSKETGPDFGGFYSLQINSYYANLLPITKPDPIRYLGQVPLMALFTRKNAAHLEVRVNKLKNAISLFIDGNLVKTWLDTQEFVGKGTGVRIVHQGQGSSKISNLRVREWDGQFEEKPTNPPDSKQDLAKLRNGDRLNGTLDQVREGKMTFTVAGRTLEVPLARVKQIEMAGAASEHLKTSLKSVRAHFARGGSLLLELEKIDEQTVVASSPAFGKATFQRAAFSRFDFDPKPLEQAKAAGVGR